MEKMNSNFSMRRDRTLIHKEEVCMDSIEEDLFGTAGTARAREIESPEMPTETLEPAAKTGLASPATLEHELIAVLAYSYWEARGPTNGSAEEDWFRAERELRNQLPRLPSSDFLLASS
jgi:hypothetical protein